MNKVALVARILLGLVFLVFGANGLLMFTTGNGFIPAPPPPPEMATIMAGFMATKYLLILVKLLEVIGGALLLSNCYVNLALMLLGPIVVNILGIHLFAEHSGLPVAIGVTVCYLVILHSRWSAFRPLLSRK